jgi:hypothetical protein
MVQPQEKSKKDDIIISYALEFEEAKRSSLDFFPNENDNF